jgi:hypothetical protein
VNWIAWLVAGFGGTVLLTAALAGTQSMGLTRMNLPYLLGTMTTPDRDRAKVIGIVIHLVNGLVFSLVYVAAFHATGRPVWWFGAAIGLVHGVFVLGVALPALPGLHPRMASETAVPGAERPLEPPGFFATNYGRGTPISVLVSHIAFGAIVGLLYRPLS